jgi:hypothetical protein
MEKLYGSTGLGTKYQGQSEPTSRYYPDFNREK